MIIQLTSASIGQCIGWCSLRLYNGTILTLAVAGRWQIFGLSGQWIGIWTNQLRLIQTVWCLRFWLILRWYIWCCDILGTINDCRWLEFIGNCIERFFRTKIKRTKLHIQISNITECIGHFHSRWWNFRWWWNTSTFTITISNGLDLWLTGNYLISIVDVRFICDWSWHRKKIDRNWLSLIVFVFNSFRMKWFLFVLSQ